MATAEANYYDGIKSSVNYWYDVAENDIVSWVPVAGTGSAPFPLDQQQLDDFLAHANVSFDGKSEAEKLKLIYGQRWVSLFWLAEEAHFLQRRTGQTPLTSAASSYFLRMPYPDTEESFNLANFKTATDKLVSYH